MQELERRLRERTAQLKTCQTKVLYDLDPTDDSLSHENTSRTNCKRPSKRLPRCESGSMRAGRIDQGHSCHQLTSGQMMLPIKVCLTKRIHFKLSFRRLHLHLFGTQQLAR